MIDLVPISMSMVLDVVTPSGDAMSACTYLPNAKVEIKMRSLPANLIILEMIDYDVILGMNWLPEHHEKVYCREPPKIFLSHMIYFCAPRMNGKLGIMQFKNNLISKFLIFRYLQSILISNLPLVIYCEFTILTFHFLDKIFVMMIFFPCHSNLF